MFELFVACTGLFVLFCAVKSYMITRDAMQPAVFMAPLFIYFYSVWPLLLNRPGGLPDYFRPEELEYVSLLYLCSIGALYIGLMKWPRRFNRYILLERKSRFNLFAFEVSPIIRKRMMRIGILLGLIALAAYWYSIFNVGGFWAAYSRAKGGGWAPSGYIGEAPLLAFPAVVLIALSRQGTIVRFKHVLLVLLVASPHLLQGFFGGRRGPMFLSLALLFLSWYIAKGRRPSFKKVVTGVTIISLTVVLVWSQRQELYLGSGGSFDLGRVIEKLDPGEISEGNEYLAGVATVLTADNIGNYYWGYRYFVTFFIRPIPKQIWPTKYEDMGADWLLRYGDEERESQYIDSVGFRLLRGSSYGYVSDVYYEFAWGAVLISYLLGRFFCMLWERHRLRGGLWTILFLELMIVSIYLPTQSLTAGFHRFFFMAGITYIVWRKWVEPKSMRRVVNSSQPGINS